MSEQKYYMQDTRDYVGNSMLWWAKDGKGYVCDIRRAHVFTLAEARSWTHRETDVLWPCEYIDKRIAHHIDMQYCEREIAGAVDMANKTLHMDSED